MNKARNITIVILALLWSIGGLRLLWSASLLLFGSAAEVTGLILIASVLLAFGIGFAKGKFVLSKSALRSVTAAGELEDHAPNYFFGWAKAWGLKGFLIIAAMIGLGVYFGSDISPVNPMIRGLIRITIGTALLVGSLTFWTKLREI